jgi:hypothetical protein
VKIWRNGQVELIACDGLLLTGRFTPEAALLWQAGHRLNLGSGGPAVDQAGRCANPVYFAAGNLLRPVETGGWSFREGTAIGRAVAADLHRAPSVAAPIPVTRDDAIKLVVPDIIRRGERPATGFDRFQLRFARACRGALTLDLDGREVYRSAGPWRPESRVLVPMPASTIHAERIHFGFQEQT